MVTPAACRARRTAAHPAPAAVTPTPFASCSFAALTHCHPNSPPPHCVWPHWHSPPSPPPPSPWGCLLVWWDCIAHPSPALPPRQHPRVFPSAWESQHTVVSLMGLMESARWEHGRPLTSEARAEFFSVQWGWQLTMKAPRRCAGGWMAPTGGWWAERLCRLLTHAALSGGRNAGSMEALATS
jgi:hypothetical protein